MILSALRSIDKLQVDRGCLSFDFLRMGYFCLNRLCLRLDSVDFNQWPKRRSASSIWLYEGFRRAKLLFCQFYPSNLRFLHHSRHSNQRLEFKSLRLLHQVLQCETTWSFAHSSYCPSDSRCQPLHGTSPLVMMAVGFLPGKEKKYFFLMPYVIFFFCYSSTDERLKLILLALSFWLLLN